LAVGELRLVHRADHRALERRIPSLRAGELARLLTSRRREALECGWREVPEWIFCSEAGTSLEWNLGRSWDRLRRRAQANGIRPLKMHAARHTWATLALGAGKSV
jgi:integrase